MGSCSGPRPEVVSRASLMRSYSAGKALVWANFNLDGTGVSELDICGAQITGNGTDPLINFSGKVGQCIYDSLYRTAAKAQLNGGGTVRAVVTDIDTDGCSLGKQNAGGLYVTNCLYAIWRGGDRATQIGGANKMYNVTFSAAPVHYGGWAQEFFDCVFGDTTGAGADAAARRLTGRALQLGVGDQAFNIEEDWGGNAIVFWRCRVKNCWTDAGVAASYDDGAAYVGGDVTSDVTFVDCEFDTNKGVSIYCDDGFCNLTVLNAYCHDNAGPNFKIGGGVNVVLDFDSRTTAGGIASTIDNRCRAGIGGGAPQYHGNLLHNNNYSFATGNGDPDENWSHPPYSGTATGRSKLLLKAYGGVVGGTAQNPDTVFGWFDFAPVRERCSESYNALVNEANWNVDCVVTGYAHPISVPQSTYGGVISDGQEIGP